MRERSWPFFFLRCCTSLFVVIFLALLYWSSNAQEQRLKQIEEHVASKGKVLLSHLLYESGLSPSKKESKRLIANGGVRMDGQQVGGDREIEIRQPVVLQVGRRKFKRIVFQDAAARSR